MTKQRSSPIASVWLFHATGATFASGVFTIKEEGLDWVRKHGVTGTLSEYAVGDGCYDLAVREGRFAPTKPHHGSASHVGGFSPGLDHVHVTAGEPT